MSLLPINQVFEFDVQTHTSTGALVDADSTPTYDVYEQGSRTPIIAGTSMTHDSTGVYYGSITCSVANGFDAGKTYQVKVNATVGGVSDKAVIARFRMVAAETTTGVPVVTATAIASGAITSSVLASGAITSSTFAASAIDASALATSAATEIATAVFANAFSSAYGSYTFTQMVEMIAAVLLGKVSGAATETIAFRNLADNADVVVAAVDTNGNRSTVLLTP